MTFAKVLRVIYFCLLLSAVHTAAEEKRAGATVWTSGTERSAKAIFGPDAQVDHLDRAREERASRRAGMLPPHERDALFQRLGIERKIAKMDEFDRDILMLSARNYQLPKLKKQFPMLTEKELSQLKAEMVKVK